MTHKMYTAISRVPLVVFILFSSGCAAFRANTQQVNVNETRHFDAEFDYSDLRKITEDVATEFTSIPLLTQAEEPPVMMIAGVQNRTGQYVDTKNLTDRIRTLVFKTGKVRFVNETRRADLLKEQGYQAAHATPESQVAVGQQLGAKYMMSGSLTEMRQKSPDQVRVSRQELNYYKLTMEVTDLTTSELVWTTEKEFARQASKPLIRW